MQNGKVNLLPESFGFRSGVASVHTARTMMLGELSLLLDHVAANGTADAYAAAVTDENVLGKPTVATRQETAKRLAALYCLDPSCTLFRLLRHFWDANPVGRPMLAFLAATARDHLLREATPLLLAVGIGETVSPVAIAQHLNETFPNRFQASTAIATAQRLTSSWAQAGFLTGKVNKKRIRPVVTPVVATFALVLGYLCGLRGELLLDSQWTRLLDRTPAEIASLVAEASKQGWLNYKAAGSVVEITFPGVLNSREERALNEQT